MAKQFQNASSTYGAPMGRSEFGLVSNYERRALRLFRVNLDGGGYDDGGAYWGQNTGGRGLYCITDKDGELRRFVRAMSRTHAALLLDIDPATLMQSLPRPLIFGRYSAHLGYFGKATPSYEVREFGKPSYWLDDWEALCTFAQQKEWVA